MIIGDENKLDNLKKFNQLMDEKEKRINSIKLKILYKLMEEKEMKII